MSVGRPSAARTKAQLLESLKDTQPAEPMRRINFELADSKVRKLKIAVAKSGHRSVKDFLTAYIDSLPED
jgi:hypothetical protein